MLTKKKEKKGGTGCWKIWAVLIFLRLDGLTSLPFMPPINIISGIFAIPQHRSNIALGWVPYIMHTWLNLLWGEQPTWSPEIPACCCRSSVTPECGQHQSADPAWCEHTASPARLHQSPGPQRHLSSCSHHQPMPATGCCALQPAAVSRYRKSDSE